MGIARWGVAACGTMVLVAGCHHTSGGGAPFDAATLDEGPPTMIDGTTLILAGAFELAGVTDDDLAIVIDDAGGVRGVPLGGGAPIAIDPLGETATVAGRAVFSWSRYDFAAGLGELQLWSPGKPAALPRAHDASRLVAATSDGKRGIFTSNASPDAGSAALWIAGTDGTLAPTQVLPSVGLRSPCSPSLSSQGPRFVLSYCASGDPSRRLATIDATSGALFELRRDVGGYQIDGPRDRAIVATTGGELLAVALADGSSRHLADDAGFGQALPDGSTVIYRTRPGQLHRVKSDGTADQKLVEAGVSYLASVSASGAWLTFGTVATAGNALHLARTDVAGAPLPLATYVATVTSAFTEDGGFVLYASDPDPLASTPIRGRPVAGGDEKVIGGDALRWSSIGGARLLVGDRYRAVAKSVGRVDVALTDAAKDAPEAAIATRVEAGFRLTAKRDRVVYVARDPPDRQGLYVVRLP